MIANKTDININWLSHKRDHTVLAQNNITAE